MLKRYDKEVNPVGETLPDSVCIFRIKIVVTSFMKAGIPINKVDCFHEVFEENAYRLTSSQNLRQLVPFIHNQEKLVA